MTDLFKAYFSVRICIEGCPERGIEALDWRRARGLPERLDNRHDVAVAGPISEDDFRRLIDAGFRCSDNADGSQEARFLHHLDVRFNPLDSYGHAATIPVTPEDGVIDLAVRAAKACAREQARHRLGAADLEARAQELTRELESIRSKLAEIEAL